MFQATNQLQSLKKRGEDRESFRKWKSLKQASILGNLQQDEVMEEEETHEEWKEAVIGLDEIQMDIISCCHTHG